MEPFELPLNEGIEKTPRFDACRGGEIGRRTGLKILRFRKGPCRFESGPRHHGTACLLPQHFVAQALKRDRRGSQNFRAHSLKAFKGRRLDRWGYWS